MMCLCLNACTLCDSCCVVLSQLEEAVQSTAVNPHVRAVILKSDVPGAFSVGADLKERVTMKVCMGDRNTTLAYIGELVTTDAECFGCLIHFHLLHTKLFCMHLTKVYCVPKYTISICS